MNNHNIGKATLIVGVLSALLMLNACGGIGNNNASDVGGARSQNSSPREIVDFAHIEKEYQESVAKLSWPEKYKAPANLVGEEKDAQFQSGYGDTQASNYYQCAWERQWLDTYASDERAASKALHELEKVPSMPFMDPDHCDDATRNFFKEHMRKAKLGDPSGFQQDVQTNCPVM